MQFPLFNQPVSSVSNPIPLLHLSTHSVPTDHTPDTGNGSMANSVVGGF